MEGIAPRNVNASEENLIKFYTYSNSLTCKEICQIFRNYHGMHLTVRRVKYLKSKYGSKKFRVITDEDLDEMIKNELKTSASLIGYRQMKAKILLRYNLNVSKERVRCSLKRVDPEGVKERLRKVIKRRVYETQGPNDVYHIDGNDKLKKWGFCIHGCIDGFSRRIMWLSVAATNNNPLVIANYYLDCITKHKTVPKMLRMDLGTENIYCQDIQVFLTRNQESFRYGSSTRNQRIEAFWSRLKRFSLSWWISFFKEMEKIGLYKEEYETHVETLMYVFLPLLQKELSEFSLIWNQRHVRQSASAPGGKPNVLFVAPECIGYEDQGIRVSDEDINITKETVGIRRIPTWKNYELHELLEHYSQLHNIDIPTSGEEGLDIYVVLLGYFELDGFDV